MGKFQLITKGLIKENPTFVLLLGMCPTLATTTSAINGSQYFGHLMRRADSFEKTRMLAGGEGEQDGWVASPTQRT